MVKFLADENIFPPIVRFLRNRGFDVKDLREEGMSGVSDITVIDIAQREGRALVTFDKHFANILLYPPSSHYGVICIRIHPPLLSEERLLSYLLRVEEVGYEGAEGVTDRVEVSLHQFTECGAIA
jgi:predicted nuclease of predicted toxin-antitoxin system